MTPLPHDKLDMRVCACQILEVIVDVRAEVSRGCPVVAELEDKLPDLRNKSSMTVGRERLLLSTEEGAHNRSKFGGHGGGFRLCLDSSASGVEAAPGRQRRP